MPDMIMDAGDGTQRVIESDAIRALVGYVEQRDAPAVVAATVAEQERLNRAAEEAMRSVDR